MMAARTSSCISARSNARACLPSRRDKRSLSRLLPIEGQASPRRTICRLSDRQREGPQFLTTDVRAGCYGLWPRDWLPGMGLQLALNAWSSCTVPHFEPVGECRFAGAEGPTTPVRPVSEGRVSCRYVRLDRAFNASCNPVPGNRSRGHEP